VAKVLGLSPVTALFGEEPKRKQLLCLNPTPIFHVIGLVGQSTRPVNPNKKRLGMDVRFCYPLHYITHFSLLRSKNNNFWTN